MTPRIDLVYFDGCPHVEEARAVLRAVFDAASGTSAGVAGSRAWREWRSDDPALPDYARGYGSPSIFVAGREVTGAAPTASATACRVYAGAGTGWSGAPDAATIAAALRTAAP